MPLEEFPVKLRLPVLWGHQDLFGHVNNCVHLRWFESARVAYWDHGVRSVMTPNDWGPILANVTCNYRKQINYPDHILVGARMVRLGRTSLTMEHAIYSESSHAIAADGHSVVVVFNYKTQQPAPISDELRAMIEATEGKPLR